MKSCLPLFVIVLACACSKKQVTTQTVSDHSETAKMIMNRQWLESDVSVIHNPDTALHDITLQFPAPERDDVLIFSADGTYKYDEGATKSNSFLKQTFVEGQWKLDEDQRTLQLMANGSADTYEIVAITDSTLVLKLTVVRPSKFYAYHLSFKRAK
jgi:hypothetical protein